VSALVYVHGTNGSGKSTLARAVLAAAGGSVGYEEHATRPNKCGTTYTNEGVCLIGKYGNACGGVDGVSPYALVIPEVERHAVEEGRVFAEGLITPGVETCATMARFFERAIFIHLATPVEDCILHVLARRTRKANDKPYDPANLYKKAQSAASWADRLERSGLEVHRLNYRQAYSLTLDVLGLDIPDVETLLS
jgi:hypothetical protein